MGFQLPVLLPTRKLSRNQLAYTKSPCDLRLLAVNTTSSGTLSCLKRMAPMLKTVGGDDLCSKARHLDPGPLETSSPHLLPAKIESIVSFHWMERAIQSVS
jgi:hypothetical protein